MKKYIWILPMKSWITIPMKNTNEYYQWNLELQYQWINTNEYGQLNPWITIQQYQ